MRSNNNAAWAANISFFNQQNAGRPTRIGVFTSEAGNTTDYWIENGLPLIGLDLDWHDSQPSVQISLEGLTRSVQNVRQLDFRLTTSGAEDGVDILDSAGSAVVLRFNQE